MPSENTQTCSAARTPIPLSKTRQVQGISGVVDTVASYAGKKYNFCGKLDMNPVDMNVGCFAFDSFNFS